ncbi:cellobiohydrolaseI [Cercophora newfieldiana]|uniref:Glucanase n=1 Tax=Cercophora newfieldiana TaxID=92897 RepID=A0AA39YAH3_9PEZI|nr:cellobiohydrolaseI [Cercophora newfieldiana]
MFTSWSIAFLLLPVANAQRVGTYSNESHPPIRWSRCTAPGSCNPIAGSLVVDADMRWIHEAEGWRSCFSDGNWDYKICNNEASCTRNCVLEGVDKSNYKDSYGITTAHDSVSLKLRTCANFACNVGSRVFLLDEEDTKYQTFVLLGNEFAFDVDLSTVECGINSALSFVAMDADGGMERFPTNEAGARYGTGYCDAQCPMSGRFVGGKANCEGWRPSATDPVSGAGLYGSCCPEFGLWNSNSHSYSMSSHTCPHDGFKVCETYDCETFFNTQDRHYMSQCDPYGCNYNPTRMGVPGFYGKGKTVDTSRNFTVITRFAEDRVYQIFVQDGKRIDTPAPEWEGLPKESGLSDEICIKSLPVFGEENLSRYARNGGWNTHKKVLSRPMVLAMSISTDHWAHNLWIDGVFPPEGSGWDGVPGQVRGDCPLDGSEPAAVELNNPRAKVTWSNIRFGPIGSTLVL